MKRIVIDPGHGGADPGAVTGDRVEKDIALVIALAAADVLAARDDCWVEVTRDADIASGELSLQSRVAFSDRHRADLFVSVHCNSFTSPAAHGFEVFRFRGSSAGFAAASAVFNAIERHIIEIAPRSVKEAGFYVLRNTQAPAILVECGFLPNENDGPLLMEPDFQQRYGEAIAEGVLDYFGLE